MRQKQLGQKMHTAATADGVSKTLVIADFKYIMVAVTTTAGFTTGALQFFGSTNDLDSVPNFTAASSKTNQYAPLAATLVEDNTVIAGGTGAGIMVPSAGTTRIYKIITEGLTFFATKITGTTGAGEVTATASCYSE
jgi:hypothetical protein